MSSEPGGAAVNTLEIAGDDGQNGFFLYLTALDGTQTASSTFQVFFYLGLRGVSDLFVVAPDPDKFPVAPDPDVFRVAPGRTR